MGCTMQGLVDHKKVCGQREEWDLTTVLTSALWPLWRGQTVGGEDVSQGTKTGVTMQVQESDDRGWIS